MRCPKCHYVSFDGQNRCRNCGYDLSLSQLTTADTLELPTNTESTATALADLSLKPDAPVPAETPTLVDRYMPPQSVGSSGRAGVARAPARSGPPPGGAPSGGPLPMESDPLDLPLFAPADADGPRAREAARAAVARRNASPGNADTAGLSAGRDAVAAAEPDTAPMRVPPSARAPVDDRPMVSGQAPPRAPLSVRRPTGEVPRARRVTPSMTPTKVEEPRLDLGAPDLAGDLDLDALDLSKPAQPRDVAASIVAARAAQSRIAVTREAAERGQAAVDAGAEARADARAGAAAAGAASAMATDRHSGNQTETDTDEAIDETLAPIGTRVAAGAIDLAFMLAIDAIVLYFTLRITALPYEAWRRLPLAPLLGFLAMLHGGYLAMFTAASGQTMGKMLTSIRVVSSHGGPVPFGSAVVRAVVWLLTIVPAGVGFIPAFLANDRRALHDRFADTKVVKTDD